MNRVEAALPPLLPLDRRAVARLEHPIVERVGCADRLPPVSTATRTGVRSTCGLDRKRRLRHPEANSHAG
jgi:hypothetical protein